MIGASISGAQLDTIDVAELAKIVEVSRAIDDLEVRATRLSGVSMRLAFGMSGLVAAFVAAGQSAARATETLRVEAPRFMEPPRFNFARDVRPNPAAPIPDRIRRRMDRGRDRR